MKEYIWILQDTIAEYITNRPIYELCTGADQIPGPVRFMRLWDQDLNWEEEIDGDREGVEREVG